MPQIVLATPAAINPPVTDVTEHPVQLLKSESFYYPPLRMHIDPTPERRAQLVESFQQRQATGAKLTFDYNHASLVPGHPAPAAGVLTSAESRPDGLYGTAIWTPACAEAIEKGEQNYISPVLYLNTLDAQGNPTGKWGLGNPAVTNTPHILGMDELIANNLVHIFAGGMEIPGNSSTPVDERLMYLLQALDLAEGATIDQVRAKWSELYDAENRLWYLLQALGLTRSASYSEVVAAMRELQEPSDMVKASEHQALVQQHKGLEIEHLVVAGQLDGKISPADADKWRGWAKEDLEATRLQLNRRDPVVPQAPPLERPAAAPTDTVKMSQQEVMAAARKIMADSSVRLTLAQAIHQVYQGNAA